MTCSSLSQAIKIATTNAARTRLIHVVYVDAFSHIRCEAVNECDSPETFRPCTVVYPDGQTMGVV
jgi:hypothetical protein